MFTTLSTEAHTKGMGYTRCCVAWVGKCDGANRCPAKRGYAAMYLASVPRCIFEGRGNGTQRTLCMTSGRLNTALPGPHGFAAFGLSVALCGLLNGVSGLIKPHNLHGFQRSKINILKM